MKILRIIGENRLISAQVFESLFRDALKELAAVECRELSEMAEFVWGGAGHFRDYPAGAKCFGDLFKGYDFFSPAYEAIPYVPTLLSLRNTSQTETRLLFIAHSPGLYGQEWLLLKPLLARGDVIVAPSRSARDAIRFLCPELDPYVKVIPHPVPSSMPLEKGTVASSGDADVLVTFCRIIDTKLIHRQIQAMAALRDRGYTRLQMCIAGPLDDPATGLGTAYSRCLMHLIQRLGLTEQVKLLGEVRDAREKQALLSRARISVNLSCSVEEALPKASIEPLSAGVPVIACRWDGYTETVGDAGVLIPLEERAPGRLDLAPEAIADAVIALLNNPISPDVCREQAGRFSPERSVPLYKQALTEAAACNPCDGHAQDPYDAYTGGLADTEGFLGKICFLKPFTWKQGMAFNREYIQGQQRVQEGVLEANNSTEMYFRTFLGKAVQSPLTYLYAGHALEPWTEVTGAGVREITGGDQDFREAMRSAIAMPSVVSGREAMFESFYYREDTALLEEALETTEAMGSELPNALFFTMALFCLKGEYERAYERFAKHYAETFPDEYEGRLLRLLAKVCRRWGKPELALSLLSAWLERFPDMPASPFVCYNCVVCAVEAEEAPAVVRDYYARLESLLPPGPFMDRVRTMLHE